jgi:predicted PurR-regulated permease PerM
VTAISPAWQRLTVLAICLCATIFVGGFVWQIVGTLSPVLGLFFGGWLLAAILEPIVAAIIRRTRAPHSLAVATTYLAVVAVLAITAIGTAPALADHFASTVASLPETAREATERTLRDQSIVNGWLAERSLPVQLDLASATSLDDLSRQLQLGSTAWLGVARDTAGTLGNVGLMFLLSAFFLVGGQQLAETLVNLSGPRAGNDVQFVLTTVHDSFEGFIRAQLVQCVLYALGVWACLSIAGVGSAPIVAIAAGLLLVVPVVGSALAIVLPVVATLLLNPAAALPIAAASILIEQVVLNVVGPRLMSRQLGLPPLLVMFAILAGGQVAGVWGAVFGIPALAAVLTCAGHFRGRWSRV